MTQRSVAPTASRAAVVALVGVAVLVAALLVIGLRIANEGLEPADQNWWLFAELIVGFAYLTAGVALVGRRELRFLGGLFVGVAMAALVAAPATQYAGYVRTRIEAPAWSWLASPSSWLWPVGAATLASLVLLALLPPARRAEPAVRTAMVGAAVCVVLLIVEGVTGAWPASIGSNPLDLGNTGWNGVVDAGGELGRVGVMLVALFALALLALQWRERRRVSDDPLPGWVLAGAALAALSALPTLWTGVEDVLPTQDVIPPVLLLATVPLLVMGAVIELMRTGPPGREITSHRYLEWTLLASGIALVYTGLVAGLGSMVGGSGPTWFLVAATGVIAVLIEPARQRARTHADRLVYGSRDNALSLVRQVVSRVGSAADGDQLLPALAASLGAEMRLDVVLIDVAGPAGWDRAASFGVGGLAKHPADVREIPLEYQGDVVGRLIVGWSESPSLRARDAATLGELAAPLALAVSWVRLAADLRRSSLAIVSAREEERRRLRRDLHDGIGPTLTGISLGLRTAIRQLERDASTSTPLPLLRRLADEVDNSVHEVKRVVRDLRPTVLDQLGLVGALGEFTRGLGAAVQFHVELPRPDPALPAAVEVAVYRIVTEALTNVVRHAAAARCWLTVEATDSVEIDIVDDGIGFASDARPGVGLTAMRERADELGGSVTVTANVPHGTRLHVRLPAVLP